MDPNPNLILNFDELNRELRTNNDRIYKMVTSLLEQKIDSATANLIIGEFRSRNEHLRQVISDLYNDFIIVNSLNTGQTQEVTSSRVAVDKNLQPETCSESGFPVEAETVLDQISFTQSKTQSVRHETPARQAQPTRSSIRTVSPKNLRNRIFRSTQKITYMDARASGYTKLVRVKDHFRLGGITLMLVALRKENFQLESDERAFVVTLLDAYDFDKYILKNYVDSVDGIRGENISSNVFKQLNLIRQNNIDELDRKDLVDLEKIEALKSKRRVSSTRELQSISTKRNQLDTPEFIHIDSDSDLTDVESNIIRDAPALPSQPALEPPDQKPILSATTTTLTDAPSPLMPHQILNHNDLPLKYD